MYKFILFTKNTKYKLASVFKFRSMHFILAGKVTSSVRKVV